MATLPQESEFGPEPVARGTFSCPHCGGARAYTRVAVRRSVTLVGMTIQLGGDGEYIECATCLSTYRPNVLGCVAGSDTKVLAEYQRALLRVLALLVVTDGRIEDAEIETVRRVYETVSGEAISAAEVVAEAKATAREPMSAARYLAQAVGGLNDHGKEQVLRGAALVSHADGSLHDREANMVRRLGAVMRLDKDRLEDLLRSLV